MPVIEVQDISKNFAALKAVDALSFKVSEGEIFGFLGQNGSGKLAIQIIVKIRVLLG